MELSGLMSYYIDLGLYITDEMVSQVALMMKIGCLKVLEIGDITCSQCMSLLKELPHCACLQTLRVTLSRPHCEVRCPEFHSVLFCPSSCLFVVVFAVSPLLCHMTCM